MKYNGKNIIIDSDITMTGQLAGHSLAEVINTHENDIHTLKSNVKFIYKYGGVGSGGAGGGGSESSTPWNFRVEIDNVARVNNSLINLGKQGEYKLGILLYKVQNRTFTIKYTYTTNNGVKVVERIIPPTQSSYIVETINLLVNGTLSISINDDEGNFSLFSLEYIVTAYSFTLNYINNDGKIITPVDNNIFVNDVKEKGLLADLYYVIATDVESAYFTYTDWNGIVSEPIELKRGSEHILLDLGKDIIDENAGNYTFIVEPHIILGGNSNEEIIDPIKLLDNLIPSDIYLKVETDGTIYENNTVSKPYLFYAGINVFRVTPYQGYLDKTSNYNITVYLNGHLQDIPITELLDLTKYSLEITTDVLEWNMIKFVISRKNQRFEKIYYFYTKNPLGSFNWYPSYEIEGSSYNVTPILSYLYKKGGSIYKDAILIPNTNKNGIDMTLGMFNKLLLCPIDFSTYKDKDCLISIGINYSKLNDIRNMIIQIQGDNSNNSIDIYQNHIRIMGTNYENFYLPIDTGEYHLISIYRRATTTISGAKAYEYVVYIDGVMETAVASFIQTLETYSKIILNSGLYNINYLEISYFNHQVYEDISENLLEQYNVNPYLHQVNYLNDTAILYHYYSYKLTFYPEGIDEGFKKAYTYASLFHNNYATGRTEVNESIITSVAENVSVPVLLLEYIEPRDNSVDWSSNGETFMSWLEERYDVTTNTTATSIPHTVNVYYSKGNSTLKKIDTTANVFFRIYLQGTSTLLYKGKNLDLAIESPEEDTTYLYSPNFDSHDTSTFLPEKRFTIKADIVDSSHSNNNAIGKFVNTVTTKFLDAKLFNSVYSEYIKNALQGFPILLFIKNCYYVNATTDVLTEDFYFMGISNFNLGRDSEFNLGYKDLRLLPENIENGFVITSIPNDKNIDNETTLNVNSYLDNFGVTEIRENKNYFDFSQSDRSFLFALSNQDTDYMFSKFKSNNLQVLETLIELLVKGISKSGGYIFDYLSKNMLESNSYDIGYKSEIPLNLVSNYHQELKRTYENATSVLTPTGITITGTLNDLISTIIGDSEQNIMPLVDYKALCEYYVICMALGLLDSVLKNLNLKKWDLVFYPSFYDMDTGLGKDNAGNNATYTAFSDYWAAAEHTLGGKTILDPAMSYKDWFDKNELGFDIPMTYLFAIAKYAYHVTYDANAQNQSDINLQLKDWYPNNLWARFRRKTKTISGWTLPTGANDNHVGCLESADVFINNFYETHLHNVPDVFFNLNYRTKYLQVNDTLFVNEEYKKLSGRRIHFVRDWLNSRFHLLDLYFNLANVSDSVQTYDLDTETWSIIPNSSYAPLENMFIDRSNLDITILQDIFSSGNNATKYSSNVNVTFTTDSYSPLCLSGAVIGRYIALSNTTEYTLEIDSAGKALNLGGSGSWTSIDSINSLIQGGSFYVNSEKLTTLFGTSGVCGSWNISLPALTLVRLTSPSYSNIISFSSIDNWPNLSTINISGSKLGLNLDYLNVSEVNASNVKYGECLIITNCSKLTSLNMSDSIFNNIQISPTNAISYFSTYTYSLNPDGSWKQNTTSANSAKCKYLTLKRAAKDGVVFISDQMYFNNGIQEGLEEITLEGYKEIYIDNCSFLNKIEIKDPDIVIKFEVTNCASEAISFSINSNIINYVDLNNFTLLKEINFNNTKKFTNVYLPNNAELKTSAFVRTAIKTLNGNNIKLSKNAFLHAYSFTLLLDDGSICSINNDEIYSDLSYTFYNTGISKETFDLFNATYAGMLNNVTNVQGMWAYCSNLSYTSDMLLEDYMAGKCRFDLSMYTNVTNANYMFAGYNNDACHPDMFKGLGSNVNTITIENFLGWNELSNNIVTLPLDWLKHIATKVSNCNSSSNSVIYKIVKYNNSLNEIELVITFKPHELFQGNSNNKITEIKNWNFEENHIIDLSDNGFGNVYFPKLEKITNSFCGCNGQNITYTQTIDGGQVEGGFLYYKTNTLTDISGSFGFNNYSSITADLSYFLPWNELDNNKLFQYVVNWDEKYHVMEYNKTVSNALLFCTIYNVLILKSTSTSLAHVFKNCVIKNTENDAISFDKTKINKTITSIPYLFSGLRMLNGDAIDWDWDIMSTLPNVKDLRHAFEKIHFLKTIPFNFFKARTSTETNVFIKSEGSSAPDVLAKLRTFSYPARIENLQYCFANCLFDEHTFKDFTPIMSKTDINSKSCVYTDDIFTDSYYRTSSSFASIEHVQNPEFDDLNKLVSSTIELSSDFKLIKDITNWEDSGYTNFINYDSVNLNCPFIAPDFFYPCTVTAKLDSCFEGCDLLGYIPDSLFKNCAQATISNFAKDVLIFPKFYAEKYNEHFNKILSIYYYIGSNFIQTTNLDNAFNWKVLLPGLYRSINEDLEARDLFVFCFKDSFNKNIISARNMLPSTINSPLTGYMFTVQHYENNVYLNPMYDKSTETTEQYLLDEYGNDITVDNEGNPIILREKLGNLGFDLTYYNSLYADNLINYLYSQFTYGNVFDLYTLLSSIKKRYNTTTSWVIQLGNSEAMFGVSANAIWPSSSSTNNNTIYAGYLLYTEQNGVWGLYDRGLTMYKANILNYTDSVGQRYNNSRSNSTGYSIIFK